MVVDECPTALPPEAQRLFQGRLKRKIITGRGITWNSRFAVLTERHLLLAPQHAPSTRTSGLDRSGGSFARYGHSTEIRATNEDIQAAFDMYVGGGAAVEAAKLDSLREAIKHLNLYTTEENFEVACLMLDTDDGSPGIDREDFQRVVEYSDYCNGVLDFIPLEEIAAVDFQVKTSGDGPAHGISSGEENGGGERSLVKRLQDVVEEWMGIDVDGRSTV